METQKLIEALSMFTENNGYRGSKLESILQNSKYTLATDRHTMMYVPLFGDHEKWEVNVDKHSPNETTKHSIDIAKARSILDTFNVRTVRKEVPCTECDWEWSKECEECGHESECARCSGSGTLLNKTAIPYDEYSCDEWYLQIHHSYVDPNYMKRVLDVAELLGESVTLHISENGTEPLLFEIWEARVLVMPCTTDKAFMEYPLPTNP